MEQIIHWFHTHIVYTATQTFLFNAVSSLLILTRAPCVQSPPPQQQQQQQQQHVNKRHSHKHQRHWISSTTCNDTFLFTGRWRANSGGMKRCTHRWTRRSLALEHVSDSSAGAKNNVAPKQSKHTWGRCQLQVLPATDSTHRLIE